jgi:hypothetical protein
MGLVAECPNELRGLGHEALLVIADLIAQLSFDAEFRSGELLRGDHFALQRKLPLIHRDRLADRLQMHVARGRVSQREFFEGVACFQFPVNWNVSLDAGRVDMALLRQLDVQHELDSLAAVYQRVTRRTSDLHTLRGHGSRRRLSPDQVPDCVPPPKILIGASRPHDAFFVDDVRHRMRHAEKFARLWNLIVQDAEGSNDLGIFIGQQGESYRFSVGKELQRGHGIVADGGQAQSAFFQIFTILLQLDQLALAERSPVG